MSKKGGILVKLILGILIPLLIIFAFSAFLILRLVKSSTTTLLDNELTAQSQVVSEEVNRFFSKYMEVTTQMAANSEVQLIMQETKGVQRIPAHERYPGVKKTLDNTTATDKETILACWLGDFDSSQLSQSDGYTSEVGWDITGRPWYQVGNTKKPMVTPPYIDASTKKMIVSTASPVYNSATGEVIGATGVDITLSNLNTILKQYKIGDTGFVIVCASNGQVIYHPDSQNIEKQVEEVNLSENVVSAIKSSTEGVYVFDLGEEEIHGYLSQVGDTGWTVLSGLPNKEYSSYFNETAVTIVVIFAIGVFVLITVMGVLARSIIKPIKKIALAAFEISKGNLDVDLDTNLHGEIGQLSAAFSHAISRLKEYDNYIDEVSQSMDKISTGNLVFDLTYEYQGEFSKLKDALNSLKKMLTKILSDISNSAEQVSSGAEQVAMGAQSLSRGTSQQANSVEELAVTIDAISKQVENNAETSDLADQMTAAMDKKMTDCKEQMSKMNKAMQEINGSSIQIGAIIKTIEDIAFQTNILALNAAVEASRAGEAGKGFAVVASEVRSLAAKSSEAAKNTAVLIETSIRNVEIGTLIADQTEQLLKEVVQDSKKLAEGVTHMAKATGEQAVAIEQVNQGIAQVSNVVQTNSSTSEESAAASEQLSGQAQVLKQLTQRFHLPKAKQQQSNLPPSYSDYSETETYELNKHNEGKY